ncbi:uncharacterized protein LOC131983242 isoform X2 [Centropristis striata]|uniref:uncharacterized protein LOC131983242 isoform X2 n=1 Tax=Centropristis striata TaxID=184440 RepID=UPI0027E1F647|nr:uncharacterized protein LOC131983242 isoform X2 [Centropristis striata]
MIIFIINDGNNNISFLSSSLTDLRLKKQKSRTFRFQTSRYPDTDTQQTSKETSGALDMMSLMDGDQRGSHHGPQCQSKAKASRPRRLHQSTLTFGDTVPCYSTTHSQSFSGRSSDGRPLVFHLREPSFPSQHHSCLDVSDIATPLQSLLQSHTKDVHGPKHITPRTNLRVDNWARYRSGQAVREITNPPDPLDPPEYCSTYRAGHTLPLSGSSPQLAGGKPTQWHHHDVLTGEQRQEEHPGKACRQTRDQLLWAARRWETDCCALRLY